MARVDLRCRCGHSFFVGEAQAKAPEGVECPACLERVPMPVLPPAAGRLPSRATSRGSENSTAKLLAAAIQPVAALPPSKKKAILLAAGALGLVVVTIVVTILVSGGSSGDSQRQKESADEARRRKYEELSRQDTKPETSPPPASAPSPAPAPAPAPAPPKPAPSTQYKPMPSSAPPPPAAPVIPPPPAAPPQETPTVPVSPDLIGRLRTELLGLPPFYLNAVVAPAAMARVNGVISSGRGSPEDVGGIEALLNGGKLKAVKEEMALVLQTLPILERESEEKLPVDRITYRESGRVLNCRILEDGADAVKISRTLAGGVGGQMSIRREEIASVEKGKGIGAEFATRWEAARKGALPAQVELLTWCKDNTLPGQAKLVAFSILRADPSNTLARAEAGLPADPVKNAEDLASGSLIVYQGKSWNPRQLREKFVSDGFTLVDGRWYSKKDKMISVPSLFRYERQSDKPVVFSGSAGLCHETETTFKKTVDVTTSQSTEQPEVKLVRRFYSPEMKTQLTPSIPPGIVPPVNTMELETRVLADVGIPAPGTKMTGEVAINVPVGATILEASVITTAEVKAGGSITVYFVAAPGSPEAGKRTRLYGCDPKESQSHPIPSELVRGTTEVNLVAVIEQTAAYTPKVERHRERAAVYRKNNLIQSPAVDILYHRLIPDWKAVLFPSNSNTYEVFRLKVALAEPAPQVDKVFAANPEALK